MTIHALIIRLTGYFAPFWRMSFIIIAGLLVEMVYGSALSLSFKFVIDDGLIGGDHQLLMVIIIALAIGAIVVAVAGLARDFLYARLVAEILQGIRLQLFEHLQRLSLDYYGRVKTGDILTRFTSDLIAVEIALTNALAWGALPLLHVTANATLLFFLDWRLAIVAMLVWPFCLIGPKVFAPRAVEASHIRKQDEGHALADVQEQITIQPMIKAFNLFGYAASRYQSKNQHLTQSMRLEAFLNALVERSSWTGVMIVQVTILATGSWMAANGHLSVGSLAAFLALYLDMALSLSYIAQYAPSLVQAAAGIHRIDEILTVPIKVVEIHQAETAPPVVQGIHFEDVSFGYQADQKQIENLHLDIRAGESMALVGASGSGKSTLINLLMRFYDPQFGRISIDGRDIKDISFQSIRSQMGIVFQDSFLFNASVHENIRLGNLKASETEIEQAAKDAEIHDFIMTLPAGYQTVIGERGGRLSGGQRQRLAIARAIVGNPRILILDEATSALDPGTEAAINQTLQRLTAGRTVLSVTHRLASATDADRVCVFHEGRLVEIGPHSELVAAGGHYAELWQKQSGISIDDSGYHATIDIDRLKALPILDQLEPKMLEKVTPLFATEQHPADRMVVYQGDRGDRFYLIVRGSVEVLVRGEGDEMPKRVAVLEDGDCFGEIALLTDLARNASIRTLTPCTFLSLQQDQFTYLLDNAPEVRARMDKILEERG